jgi:hypothetical protein
MLFEQFNNSHLTGLEEGLCPAGVVILFLILDFPG